ncbi:MAG: hypothetical protein AB1457_14850 [Chloroflexota bacterium]
MAALLFFKWFLGLTALCLPTLTDEQTEKAASHHPPDTLRVSAPGEGEAATPAVFCC